MKSKRDFVFASPWGSNIIIFSERMAVMKKSALQKAFSLLLGASLLLSLLPVALAAGSVQVVVLKLGSNQMVVGDQLRQVDEDNAAVVPFAENGRTLVPVSRIVSAFGGRSSWEAGTNSTVFSLSGHQVNHIIGSKTVEVDSRPVEMEVPSRALNNRTYVPVRYVLEGLGLTVNYEPQGQYIIVSDGPVDQSALASLPQVRKLASAAVPASVITQGTRIAPAVSRASAEPSYDTASLSGVYLPDLAATSGRLLSAGDDPNDREDNYVTYHAGWDSDTADIQAAVREYCDLLSSLPYLEVAQPLVTQWGYTSMGWRYTGTGSVRTGKGSSFNTKAVCDVNFYMEENGRKVSFWIADGLQVVDAEAGQVWGDRACDAYYNNGGTYYNSSDAALSVKSGQCALLVNGASYTGSVDFHTESSDESWAVDKFTVSGFKRSDWVEIAFPMNYAQAGDIYTTKDFQRYSEYPYSTTNMGETWAFAVSSANGSNFVMPMANADNLYDGVTVRVLQWNKSGDTVIYFCGKLLLDGRSYEVEGLLAAPNRVAGKEQNSGSGGLFDDICRSCNGTGTCPDCGGSGKTTKWLPGTTHTYVEQNCTGCHGTGRCRDCYGDGRV